MPHYLIQGSYTAEGTKGLLVEGGSSRIAQATALVESVGGTVECLYFAYGADDIIGVCEMPDTSSAAAVSLADYPWGTRCCRGDRGRCCLPSTGQLIQG